MVILIHSFIIIVIGQYQRRHTLSLLMDRLMTSNILSLFIVLPWFQGCHGEETTRRHQQKNKNWLLEFEFP
jgi:hypothetical protein